MGPKATYNRLGRDSEVLSVDCWCRCQTVTVPADVVRALQTYSCGRSLCNALGYSAALTADGQPCDCAARQPTALAVGP